MSITLTSVTLNNNSAAITVNSPSVNLSSVQSGWMIFIDGYSVPLEIASGGQDSLTLAETYTGSTLTARLAVVVETKAALTDAIEAINLLGGQLVTAKDDYQVALDAQGTAATHDVTTSATDTTVNRLLKVGDFGVGVQAGDPVVYTGNLDTLTTSGLYYSSSGGTGRPEGAGNGYVLVQCSAATGSNSQTYINASNGRFWIRVQNYDEWNEWQEYYHSGNTNFDEFGGVSTFDDIAVGAIESSTSASFALPLASRDLPSSITPVGTFIVVNKDTGSVVKSGIPPADIQLGSNSSNRLANVVVSNLTGISAGVRYSLRTTAAADKITVNF